MQPLAVHHQPFPNWIGIFGFIVAGIFAGFLFLPIQGFMITNDEIRVGINWLAVLEWFVLFGILSWVLIISILYYRQFRDK